MVVWNAYFALKLFLLWRGSINLSLPLNLAFLAFVACPLPPKLEANRMFLLLRQLVNTGLAAALLWHDSWLPPPLEAREHLGQQGLPSLGYIVSFIGGYFDVIIVAVVVSALGFFYLARKFRLANSVAVALALIAAPLLTHQADSEAAKEQAKAAAAAAAAAKFDSPQKYLESFYGSESERVVLFKKPSGPAFDIVIVHVCSMAWQDLKEVGLDKDSFFGEFDYSFTNFNSVSSYSNPSVLRLLRSNCGQTSHTEVYNPAPATCMLFESLKSDGYVNYVSMSHDGHYGDYIRDIKQNGLDNAQFLMPDKGMKKEAIFFDESSTFNDATMFAKWQALREQPVGGKVPERAALYYNTVNLHAGSHWADEKKWWTRDKKDQYQDVAAFMVRDLHKFVDSLKAGKRNTVMIFLPEHGRALSGSPIQAADLRDIPTPLITHVPAGIKFFGPAFTHKATVNIDKPASYMALSWLLARFIEKSPFGPGAEAPDTLVKKVPGTDYVAENQSNIVIDLGGTYYLSQKPGQWQALTPAQLGQ